MGTVEPLRRPGAEGSPRDLKELDDEELMLLVKAGREAALEALIVRHQDFVLGFAARFLGDRSTARDVAQEVFLSLWAERGRYQSRGRFRGYLYRVTLNRCRYLARGRTSQRRAMNALGAEAPVHDQIAGSAVDTLLEQERAREVQQRLVELPDKPRQVLILRFTYGMSLQEIAQTTDMRLGTVKSHLSRGLKRLGALLTPEAP